MRDEDLRADRQPEFSQIDLEMSFVTEEDVFALVEGLMATILKDGVGVDLPIPFPRATYHEAMNRFGSDKPDLRYTTELVDVTDVVRESSFRAFADAIAAGGVVKGFRVEARHQTTRKVLDELEEVAKLYGAKGLARAKVAGGALDTGIAKFLSEEEQRALAAALGGEEGDVLLFVADRWATACTALGQVRLAVGRRFTPPSPTDFRFLWVHDFPLFEADPDTGALTPCHHIFTQPRPEHLALLDTDPVRVHAQLYDLALNGVELGSGSIRVHNRALQEKLLRLIGMEVAEAERRFGFLLRALQYGAPPHGGIALGVERIIMILAGRDAIRDTIAFPKTTTAASLMDGSPAPVDPGDLDELHLSLRATPTAAR
jgi:aspartyl-tRNA synthetase